MSLNYFESSTERHRTPRAPRNISMSGGGHYSVQYSGGTANGDVGSAVLVPGQVNGPPTASRDDGGISISPTPCGIVIKTKLLRRDGGGGALAPTSSLLAGISSSGNDGAAQGHTEGATANEQPKVFVNVVSHPMIAAPGKRKAFDDDGKAVEGWRLPMSMGDVRACYDRQGNAALAADCVLSPHVVRDMKASSSQMHFVCDLVVQAASRKFGAVLGDAVELDRRIKLPRMHYAGLVDEETGLPLPPPGGGSSDDGGRPKGAVARQRIRARSAPLVEEIAGDSPCAPEADGAATSAAEMTACSEPTSQPAPIRVELLVNTGDRDVPLFDFLRRSAERCRSSAALRELISTPELKCRGEKEDESGDPPDPPHDSQLLTAPVPLDLAGTPESDSLALRAVCYCSGGGDEGGRSPPTVDLSSCLLILGSSGKCRTECVLPFYVDPRGTTATYAESTGTLTLEMPLLVRASNIDDGPDPGTRQYELQHALGLNSVDEETVDHVEPTSDSLASAYFAGDEDAVLPVEEMRLPEDSFHAADAMSQHMLRKQEEERQSHVDKAEAARGRENAAGDSDVEYIDGGDSETRTGTSDDPVFELV